MKYLVSILIVVTLLTSCKSTQFSLNYFDQKNDFENDYERELLKGKVQTYAVYNNESSQNDSTDPKQLNVEFNDKGFITQFESYNKDGSLNFRIENKYTNDTILTETNRYYSDNQQVNVKYSIDSITKDD
jgi:hypothetical protein